MFYRECPYYKASQPRLQSRALIAALLSMLYWSLCFIHFYVLRVGFMSRCCY